MYDRTAKYYDEPHSPETLDRMSKEGRLNSGKFLTTAHHHSYYLQMLTIRKLGVTSVLEIGPGENFVADYLRTLGVTYDTMDIVEQSKPMILGRLEDIDEQDYLQRWQLVCAFQMLEHSPYELFVENIRKMSAMSSEYVFISVPYSCFGFTLSLKLAFGQSRRISKTFSMHFPLFAPNRRYRDEYRKEFPWAVHYWEIGRRGFPLRRILTDIESQGLRIIDSFRSENPFHFFILAKKF